MIIWAIIGKIEVVLRETGLHRATMHRNTNRENIVMDIQDGEVPHDSVIVPKVVVRLLIWVGISARISLGDLHKIVKVLWIILDRDPEKGVSLWVLKDTVLFTTGYKQVSCYPVTPRATLVSSDTTYGGAVIEPGDGDNGTEAWTMVANHPHMEKQGIRIK